MHDDAANRPSEPDPKRPDHEDAAAGPEPEPAERFAVIDGGIVCRRVGRGGEIAVVPLSNFDVRIVERVVIDDGQETTSHLRLEATVEGATLTLTVPAKQFSSLSWIEEKLGPRAIVEPGFQVRDYLRAAIQVLSEDIQLSTVYRHVGWREIGGEFVYLTADGALGARGIVPGILVEPPDALRLLSLPAAPTPEQVRCAVTASIEILGLGPPRVMFPLFAALVRSVLGEADFALAIVGRTGEFKTATAALIQQHFGPRFDHAHLPGNWSSTANALEETLFLAKDMIAVVDDYAPQSSAEAARTLQTVAGRILRSVGNRQGRQRMRSDTTVRAARPPRGLLISTGEDLPPGQSIRARVLIIDVEKGDISKESLTRAQDEAASGRYAEAMGAYVQWLAPRIREIQATWGARVAELAARLPEIQGHRRTHRIVSELLSALWLFLEFARESGVLSTIDETGLFDRARLAIVEAAEQQAEYQQRANPAENFVEVLRAALVSGAAHLRPIGGELPEPPAAYGWQATGSGYRPGGPQVGWIAEDGLYVEPTVALSVVRRLEPNALTVTTETLCKGLFEAGFLASTETRDGKRRFKVRRTIDGFRRDVLHLRGDALIGEVAHVAPPAPADPSASAPQVGTYGVESVDAPDDDGSPPAIPVPR